MILISEKGDSLGKVSFDQAMYLACDKELDLVLVNPNINPPIAKLIDYDKEAYKQAKAIRKHKAKQRNRELKEIKLGIKIDKHDLETKSRLGNKFLNKGHNVRVLVVLRGRENLFKDKVRQLIENFRLLTNSQYEQNIKQDKNRYNAILKK
jgi:translation initiation factor IF-3